MIAYIFKRRGGGWDLYICRSPEEFNTPREVIGVAGKREAAKLCKTRGIRTWNF